MSTQTRKRVNTQTRKQAIALLLLPLILACGESVTEPPKEVDTSAMAYIPAGEFLMGAPKAKRRPIS